MPDDILKILNELEAEENAREARRRGFTRIREVILYYNSIIEAIPKLETNLEGAKQNYHEVSTRLNDQLASLRSQSIDARKQLEEEANNLASEQLEIKTKRAALQDVLTEAETETKRKLAVLELQIRNTEARLQRANDDFKAFQKRVAV